MALDVHEPAPSSHSTLDGILQHHLCLDQPQTRDIKEDEIKVNVATSRKRTLSQPPMKFGTQQSSKMVVNRSTIESDNKRRLGIMKRNASKYEPPLPEPTDPNSEAKSVTIQRMQTSLEGWETKFQDILQKKAKNDTIYKSELDQRDKKIEDLSGKYSSEHILRVKTERERNGLSENLNATEQELMETKLQMEQLQNDLAQYQLAYQETETTKVEWEQEATFSAEQLEKSEAMRRRLNDHVTELQGQLAIEEQRSKICVLL